MGTTCRAQSKAIGQAQSLAPPPPLPTSLNPSLSYPDMPLAQVTYFSNKHTETTFFFLGHLARPWLQNNRTAHFIHRCQELHTQKGGLVNGNQPQMGHFLNGKYFPAWRPSKCSCLILTSQHTHTHTHAHAQKPVT